VFKLSGAILEEAKKKWLNSNELSHFFFITKGNTKTVQNIVTFLTEIQVLR